jgi:hypothetical protein
MKIKFVYRVSIDLQVWRQAQNKNGTSFPKVVMFIKEKFQFKLLNKVNFDLFLQKTYYLEELNKMSESYFVEVLTVDTISVSL